MGLDRRIQILESAFNAGQLDEMQYALGLKKFYDRIPKQFDARSLRYMESKLVDAGLPLTDGRQGQTDGVLAQITSGLLEGFTTFGFADEPDTSTEKIANSLSHLVGLAPGVVVQALSGGGAATALVARGMRRQAKARGVKQFEAVADRLESVGESLQYSNNKVARAMHDVTTKLPGGKALRSPQPIGVDIKTGEKLYGMQSVPGIVANFVQKQSTSFLKDNNIKAAEFIHKGVFKNRFMDAATRDNIVNQSVHLGLLLGASAREQGLAGMGQAAVQGAIAGGIFGGIGEYANIGRMLASKNVGIRTAGEKVVRGFAKALKEQPNRRDQFETINFLMKGTAGAAYGTTTAKLHDMPLEDQIYETLMAVFFSVNSRAAFENRATRDIFSSDKVIPRDFKMKEARKWITEQPWYQAETPEYQAYWSRYLKDIQRQQMDYVVNNYNDIIVALAPEYRDLKEQGFITPEMETRARTDNKTRETILEKLYEAAEKAERKHEDTFNIDEVERRVEEKEFEFSSMEMDKEVKHIEQDTSIASEYLPKQRTLKNIFVDIKKVGDKTSKDLDPQELHQMFKKLAIDTNFTPDNFIKEVEGKFKIKVSEEQKMDLVQAIHKYKHLDKFKISRIYLVPEEGKGRLKRRKTEEPVFEEEAPEVDIYNKPIGGKKSGTKSDQGSRLNKIYAKDDKQLHLDIDYLTTVVSQRYYDAVEGKYKPGAKIKNVSPLSIDIFAFSKDTKDPISAVRNMSKKQLDQLRNNLEEKEGLYIHAAVSDTGRLQVRQFPWSSRKNETNYISDKELKKIDRTIRKELGGTDAKKYKSNVGFVIWRMKEMNLIDAKYTAQDIIDTLPTYFKTEPYTDVTKMQKYTKHMSGIEVPIDNQYIKDEYTHALIKDLPGSIKNMGPEMEAFNSGTDGASMLRGEKFDRLAKAYGLDPETGVIKTIHIHRPGEFTNGNKRGTTIIKTATFRMDPKWEALLDRTEAGKKIDYLHYDTAVKEISGAKRPDVPGKTDVTWKSKLEDNYINLDVYENFNKLEKLKLLRQVTSNLNTIDMDPTSTDGKIFWNKWQEIIDASARGDAVVSKEVSQLLKSNQPLGDKVSLDKIDIRLIDQILNENPTSITARSILRKLFTDGRSSERDKRIEQDFAEYGNETYNKQLIEDYLISTDFEPGAFLRPGVIEFINEKISDYAFKRLTRPVVEESFSSKLGLYDVIIRTTNFKYSSAKKGLADNEFLLHEGARIIPVTDPTTQKKSTLGKVFDKFEKEYDLDKNSDTTKQLKETLDNVMYIRSPMVSNSGVRIGNFVGFVKGRKGISIITNEVNDFNMNGADKDIDSAHVFWGMPKEITKVYARPEIQNQLLKEDGTMISLSDAKIAKELANAKFPQKETRKQQLANMIDIDAKLGNGLFSAIGKDSVGYITNQFQIAKQEFDLRKQLMIEDGSGKVTEMQTNELPKIWKQLIIDQNVLQSTFIDANKLVDVDLPSTATAKLRGKYKDNLLEAEDRIVLRDMYKLVFSKVRKDEAPLEPNVVSQKYLDMTEGTTGYLRMVGENINGLKLEINPYNAIDKDAIIPVLKDLSKVMKDHPLFKKANLREFDKWFMEGIDGKEMNTIKDYPPFLWNKINGIVDLSNALKKAQAFKEYAVEVLEMNPSAVDKFIVDVIETTFEQRNKIYQSFDNNKQWYKKQNVRSYGDQIYFTKESIKEQLETLTTARNAVGKPLTKQGKMLVEDLFDVFYIANPVIDLNFTGFRGKKRFDFLTNVNRDIKELLKLKAQETKLTKGLEEFSKQSTLDKLYEQRGALQREFVGSLPDLEQTWSIKARNKQYMARERYKVLELAVAEKDARIEQFKKDFDFDNLIDYVSEDITPPSTSSLSEPVVVDTAKPAVNRTKQVVPDLIDIDVLTDPKKLDKLIDTKKKLTSNQTEGIKKDLDDLRDVIKYQIANGNPGILYNISSLYSNFFQGKNREIDLIQDVDGLRLKYFVKHMKNQYGPNDAFDAIRRNKELINQARKDLYVDMTDMVPLKTFAEYAKEQDVFVKMMSDLDLFKKTRVDYRKYVMEWANANEGSITKLSDQTQGKILKDKDNIVYGYNKKTKVIKPYKNIGQLEKDIKANPLIQKIPMDSLSSVITDKINFMFPIDAHLRSPKGIDQVLGIYQRLDQLISPFEKRFQLDRGVKFNPKTRQMDEYGILVPTSTLKTIAENIYENHSIASQLKKFNVDFVGFNKKILNTKQKVYTANQDILWEVAVLRHVLGPDKLGPKKNNTLAEERIELQERLDVAEKKLSKISEKLYYTNKQGDQVFVDASKYTDVIRNQVIQPIMDFALKQFIESNYKNIEKAFGETIYKNVYSPDKKYAPSHPLFYQQRLMEMFFNANGIISPSRLMAFDKSVRIKQDTVSGSEILRNHFHLDDIKFLNYAFNVRQNIHDKYSQYLNKSGELDWNLLDKTLVKGQTKFTLGDKIRKELKSQQLKLDARQLEVGKFKEQDESARFWSYMGSLEIKENKKKIVEDYLPAEKKRIMSKKVDQLLDPKMKEDVLNGEVTLEDARFAEYQQLENKILKTNKYENPNVDQDAADTLNQVPTRRGKTVYPGLGMSTHARSRTERALPFFRTDGNVPLEYMDSMSRGLTQNISALYTRIYLDKFLEQGRKNETMSDVIEQWHSALLDFSKGYMGQPSTRNIEVHGFNKKDYVLLKEWQDSGYDQSWKYGKLNNVEKKLLLDMEAAALPTYTEQRAMKKKLVGELIKKHGKDLKGVTKEKRDEFFMTTIGPQVKTDFTKWMQKSQKENLNLLIDKDNIDKLKINFTPRQWFSDESVGNTMLKIEGNINKVYGKATKSLLGKEKQMFQSLPEDPILRHKAMVDMAQYMSDLEGKFEVFSLLFHPKAAITNVYGGYQNVITDTGFTHFVNSFREDYLINEVFAGKKFRIYDPKTKTYQDKELKSMEDVHMMIDSLGLLEGNLLQELTYLQAKEPAQVKKFLSELVKRVTQNTKKNKLWGNSKEVNEKNDAFVKETIAELATKYNVDAAAMEVGSVFMSASEKLLRRKAFLSHYLKARELYADTKGNIKVTDEFLVKTAKKGVEGSQFIYHATYRPNFSNTAFGRVMTRFQPYMWSSIRRRKTMFEDMMAVEGHANFEATKRFERQIANDAMTMALASVFAYSIFEYALSPPMNMFKDTAEFLFGDEKTRERAFFNQYPIKAMAPLQIVTPPAARFIMPHVNALVNGNYEAFWNYTAWTYLPGGRLMRDVYKTTQKPNYWMEYSTGIPRNSMKWYGQRVEREQRNRDIMLENLSDE